MTQVFTVMTLVLAMVYYDVERHIHWKMTRV